MSTRDDISFNELERLAAVARANAWTARKAAALTAPPAPTCARPGGVPPLRSMFGTSLRGAQMKGTESLCGLATSVVHLGDWNGTGAWHTGRADDGASISMPK